MNLAKNKQRSRLIDENLEMCLKLKTTSYKPDLSIQGDAKTFFSLSSVYMDALLYIKLFFINEYSPY